MSSSSSSSSPAPAAHKDRGCKHRRSFWNLGCDCLLSALPDETLLFHVLPFLSTTELLEASRVCRRWNFLCHDPMLWRSLDLSRLNQLPEAGLPHGQRFKSKLLPLPPAPAPAAVPAAAPVPAEVPQRVSDRSLDMFTSRHGDSLLRLKLCNCHALTADALLRMSTTAPRLTELHLCNLRSVTDALLVRIGETCTNLRHLSLFGCQAVTDAGVRALTRLTAPTLRELSLRGCSRIGDAALAELGTGMVELNVGDCHRITSVALPLIAARCPRLRRLNLHGIAAVDDHGVAKLALGCRELRTVHLSHSGPLGSGTSRLTDDALFSLSDSTTLVCVNLQGASALTDRGMAHFFRSCRSLERLNLGRCFRITDASVTTLAHNCPRLTHISLFQCFKLTRASLAELAERVPGLLHLDMHSCVGIGRHIVHFIAATAAWPRLGSLDISGCKAITHDDVIAMKRARPHIRIVRQ